MPAVAALFNYFIFSTIAYAILAISSTLFHVKLPLMIVKFTPFMALITAIYFQFRQLQSHKKKTSVFMLTPGEIMVGFKQRSEGKEWAPALRGNMAWWIGISIINFLVIGGYWSFLSNGYIYNWVELTLRIVMCFLFFGAMITVGNGRVTAFVGILLVVTADYFLTGLLYSDAATVANGYFNINALVQIKSGLWAAVNSSALLYYLYHQNPERFIQSIRRRIKGQPKSK